MNETDTQVRLRRAKEALSYARDREATARMAHLESVKAVASARARYEELFLLEENEERARRITIYRH